MYFFYLSHHYWCSVLKQILGIQFLQLSLSKALRLTISYVSLVFKYGFSLYAVFLFLSSLPSTPQSLLSQEFPLSKFVQAIVSSFPTQCWKSFLSFTMSYTCSFVLWSFQLMFSILRHVHISKASNLSLSFFLNVKVSVSLPTIVFIIFFFRSWREYFDSLLNNRNANIDPSKQTEALSSTYFN